MFHQLKQKETKQEGFDCADLTSQLRVKKLDENKFQMLRCKHKGEEINTLLAMWLMKRLKLKASLMTKSIYVQNFKVPPLPLAMDCHL